MAAEVKTTVFQTVIETQNPVKDGGQLVEKVRFLFCASCDSTHKIEFAQQIHKNRGRVPRFLYKGRKNVSGGRGFSSAFDRKRGFDREAARKTIVFRQPQKPFPQEWLSSVKTNVQRQLHPENRAA